METEYPEPVNIIRGIPLSVVFKKETVEEALDYMPQEGDVIIATYPKTGTTWMQYIVNQILTRGKDIPNMNEMMEKIVPFLEMAGVAAVDAITSKPRVYKHHFPYNKVKKNPDAKIIYVYRRPDDTFVSYFHFMNAIVGPLDFDKYFEGFIAGKISYGRYFEHVLSFLEYKDQPNLLLVSYEKLKLNPAEQILRIAKFIGQEHYDDIANDESVLNNIVEHTSFDYMKKSLSFKMKEDPTQPKPQEWTPPKNLNFFRKGTIGDGKNSLSEEQQTRIKNIATEIMQGTDILKEWYN